MFRLIASRSDRDVTEVLCLSSRNHRSRASHVLAKLGVANREEDAAFATHECLA